MKRTAKRILPLLFVGMLMHTGCAKQELVKKDEPLAPPAARAQEATPPTSTAAAAKPATANAVANADAKPKAPAQSGSQSRIVMPANRPRVRTRTAPLSCCAPVTQYGKLLSGARR